MADERSNREDKELVKHFSMLYRLSYPTLRLDRDSNPGPAK